MVCMRVSRQRPQHARQLAAPGRKMPSHGDGAAGPARLPARIILIQALHHGNDHRTHICTVLGNHSLGYGEMDVWSFADATGVVEFVKV